MTKINGLAVMVSAVAAFVMGGLWYSPLLFGKAYVTLRGLDSNGLAETTLSAGEVLGEFVRWLVLAFILARFMAVLGITAAPGALTFGAWMWLAIYTALAGSVIHEVPRGVSTPFMSATDSPRSRSSRRSWPRGARADLQQRLINGGLRHGISETARIPSDEAPCRTRSCAARHRRERQSPRLPAHRGRAQVRSDAARAP